MSELSTACIEFAGKHRDKDGYGRVFYQGKKGVPAHRVAYCENRDIPLSSIAGQIVRHECDNPACINPDHLLLGSQADNVRDRCERGRSACGERNSQSKLDAETVQYIRTNYKPRDPVYGAAVMARRYGVVKSLVAMVVRREIWAHVKTEASSWNPS